MSIAASSEPVPRLLTCRRVTALADTDPTDVMAVVIIATNSRSGTLALLKRIGSHLPMFLYFEHVVELSTGVTAVINGGERQWLELESAACQYEENLLPPFYDTLTWYVEMGNGTFACPKHQHGTFLKKYPAGCHFYNFFGESILRANICNTDVKLGDLLIHGGSARDAQKFAAKVFYADKTYFVLDGTSAANKVATNALLMRGDLVFFDHNNHRSNHRGALIQAGTTPVYLEASRSPFGFIGGTDARCSNEKHLRQQIRDVASKKADLPCPSRLAIIQLGTYDGIVYNARRVIDTAGHLCGYILFDFTWIDYEQFIPMMAGSPPLLLELNESNPGIFMTQSAHKQQTGFSQTSQIHKRDSHIRGQARFCPRGRLNGAFMLHASTSPFYLPFATPDVNTKIHEGESERRLWIGCIALGIEARKAIPVRCKLPRPLIPPVVDDKLWQDYPTSVLASDRCFFDFEPGVKWYGFEGYIMDQYFVDPCKLLPTTPGTDAETGKYSDLDTPATILAHYLRENGIVLEKCDLNPILFLLIPAESHKGLAQLMAMLAQFGQHIEGNSPLAEVLPSVYNKYPMCYCDHTLCQLCQEMHDLCVSFDVKDLQKAMFRQQSFPLVVMNPQDAHSVYIRGEAELVRIRDAEG